MTPGMLRALRTGQLICRVLFLVLAVTALVQILDGTVSDWASLVIIVAALGWLLHEDRQLTREIEDA